MCAECRTFIDLSRGGAQLALFFCRTDNEASGPSEKLRSTVEP